MSAGWVNEQEQDRAKTKARAAEFARRCYDFVAPRTGSVPGESLRQPSLVFAPHQDDETLGCGGAICRMSDLGTRVDVAFLTDGSGSHSGIPGDELSAIREREARLACRELGVPEERVHFLGFPDGSLIHQGQGAVERIAALLDRVRPAQVFVNYRHDAHPCHEATFRLVMDALLRSRREVVLYEYCVWFWHRWPFIDKKLPLRPRALARTLTGGVRDLVTCLSRLRYHLDVADVLPRKERALAAYATQMTRFNGAEDWATLGDIAGGSWLARTVHRYEQFARSEVRPGLATAPPHTP